MRAKQRRPSGAWEMPRRTISCGGVTLMSIPRKWIVPDRAGVRPQIDLSVVDFPAPLDPIRVTTSPARTDRLIPFSASMLP